LGVATIRIVLMTMEPGYSRYACAWNASKASQNFLLTIDFGVRYQRVGKLGREQTVDGEVTKRGILLWYHSISWHLKTWKFPEVMVIRGGEWYESRMDDIPSQHLASSIMVEGCVPDYPPPPPLLYVWHFFMPSEGMRLAKISNHESVNTPKHSAYIFPFEG